MFDSANDVLHWKNIHVYDTSFILDVLIQIEDLDVL